MGSTNNSKYFRFPLDWSFEVKDKRLNAENMIRYFLDRTEKIFVYSGLPETLPARVLERMLQTYGFVFFTDQPDKEFRVFYGGLGGEAESPYYEPTWITVANPALNFSKMLKFDEDGILIRNDSQMMGLLPMIGKYSSLMAENEITLRTASVVSRMMNIITAASDSARESAERYIRKLEDGELAVMTDKLFEEAIHVNPARPAGGLGIIELIELQQYLKASLYNELGLQSNYNMKREAIGANEGALNEDALFPLVDNMLDCRRDAIQKINDKYGLSISVNLSSSWADNEEEKNLELEEIENADMVGRNTSEA